MLKPVGHEEDPAGPSGARIKGTKEGLADTRRGDDDGLLFAPGAKGRETFKGLALSLIGLGEVLVLGGRTGGWVVGGDLGQGKDFRVRRRLKDGRRRMGHTSSSQLPSSIVDQEGLSWRDRSRMAP